MRQDTRHPPTAHFVKELTSVAYNYHETKRDRNRAKRAARRARREQNDR